MEEHTRRQALAVVIDRLEATMRAADTWEDEPPPERLLASTQPFCFDTLTFTQWLQWLMIPRMRSILDNHEELPQTSAILPYAEEFVSERGHGRELLRLIERFDELISA
ncbi:MAG TPA: YqcC family protein [Gammaproteobacteria bacterium]